MTQELLESYLSQKLNSGEMYEVEHHILECDFCGEALDGLEGQTPTEVQIAFEKIQLSLDSRKPKQKWASDLDVNRSPLLVLGLILLALGAMWLLSSSSRNASKLNITKNDSLVLDEETKAEITKAFTLDTRSVKKRQELLTESQSPIAQAQPEENPLFDDRGGSGNSQGISRGSSGGQNSGLEEIEAPGIIEHEPKLNTDTELTEIDPDFNQVAIGQVLDAKTKAPLTNVYLEIDGEGNQVSSNDQGYYNLSLNGSQAIVSILYKGVAMDKLAVDNENQLKVYLDLERKEISNIIYITNANHFK